MDATKTKGNQCLSYTKKSTIVYHLVKKGSPVVSNQKLVHSFLDHFMLPWKRKNNNTIIPCKCVRLESKCWSVMYKLFNFFFFFLRIIFWWFVILDGFFFLSYFFSGFRYVWITACLSNPVKSYKMDERKHAEVKSLDHITRAAFKMSMMYLYTSCFCFITAFCTWRSFASQLILC